MVLETFLIAGQKIDKNILIGKRFCQSVEKILPYWTTVFFSC